MLIQVVCVVTGKYLHFCLSVLNHSSLSIYRYIQHNQDALIKCFNQSVSISVKKVVVNLLLRFLKASFFKSLQKNLM